MRRPGREVARGVVALAVLSLFIAAPDDLTATRASAAPGAGWSSSPGRQSRQDPPTPTQQPAPPLFRVRADFVEIDVLVTDRNGNFVEDLKADDFRIFEDGKPQSTATFELVNLPWTSADTGPAEISPVLEPHGVVTGDVESSTTVVPGRVYVVVVDDLHINPYRSPLARAVAKRFITQAVGVGDLAAVVSTGGRRAFAQEFTANRRTLMEAVDRVVGAKADSPTQKAIGEPAIGQADKRSQEALVDLIDSSVGREPLGSDQPPPLMAQDGAVGLRLMQARSMLDTLRRLSRFVSTIRGRRKAIVVIGEGFDFNLTDPLDAPREVRDLVRDMIATANRANVSLYTIDPRGATQGGDEAVDIIGIDHRYIEAWLASGQVMAQNQLKVSQEGLQVLAEGTGGFAVVNTSGYRNAFDRIRKESSTYYLLSYSPTNDRRDGKARSIEVKVARPGLTVRARKGYIAEKGKAPAPVPVIETRAGTSGPLREALESPVPAGGLSIAATAVPFRGAGAQASVAVLTQIGAQGVTFLPVGDRQKASLELSMVAVDGLGRVQAGDRLEIDLPLTAPMHSLFSSRGMIVQSRLDLPPGRYQVRLGVRDALGGRIGTVRYDVEVPDFAAPLSMGGLLVGSRQASGVPTPRHDQENERLLSSVPTTRRVFAVDDVIKVATELYHGAGYDAPQVEATATLATEGGFVVYRFSDQRAGQDFGGAHRRTTLDFDLPLRELTPGSYVLTVRARSTDAQPIDVSRELRFDVR